MSEVSQRNALVRSMPIVFVLIWSTGFIVARFGMPHAPPMKFLTVRYLLSVACFALWAIAARVPMPADRTQVRHLAITGVLMHAGYLGGVWAAVKLGMGAGLVALLVGLQPVLTAVWVSSRGGVVAARQWAGLALGFAVAIVFANVYPFARGAHTERLTMLHLPIALGLLVGVAYAGGRWGQVAGRMDFIRFSGELFIYYVLIALGGGVLTGFMAMIFRSIGIDVEPFFQSWWLPCGAAGAVLVASWLVEAKQSVVENMAPVLTRLFTPLFAAVLVTFLGALLVTGHGVDIERDALIDFNLILVVVLALLLYSVSARDPRSSPGLFDGMQVVLVVSALVADAVALWAIAARITDLGFSANRVAALGVNAILLINLAWSAALYVRFLRGRGSIGRVERWQTDYLPVYAAWSALVVIAFPPLFGYA